MQDKTYLVRFENGQFVVVEQGQHDIEVYFDKFGQTTITMQGTRWLTDKEESELFKAIRS